MRLLVDADLEQLARLRGRRAYRPIAWAAAMREGADHRHHRPGRLLPGRAAAREGLRGARDRPPLLELQHRPDRPPLPRPARDGRAAVHALRRPRRTPVALTKLLYELQPDEIYHLGAQSHVRVSFDIPEYTFDVTGAGTLRLLEAIRESGVEHALLPGLLVGDVRRRAAAAVRGDAVPPAQPLRGREGGGVLGDGQLPRGYGMFAVQRDPLQPRVAAPRRDLRDPQDHARGRADQGRACRTSSTSATSTPSATGATRPTTSRRCG